MAKSIILFIIELFIGLLPAIAIMKLDLGENPSQEDFCNFRPYFSSLYDTFNDYLQ